MTTDCYEIPYRFEHDGVARDITIYKMKKYEAPSGEHLVWDYTSGKYVHQFDGSASVLMTQFGGWNSERELHCKKWLAENEVSVVQEEDEDEDEDDEEEEGELRWLTDRVAKLPEWMKVWKREKWPKMVLLFALNCIFLTAIFLNMGMERLEDENGGMRWMNVQREWTMLAWLFFFSIGIWITLSFMFTKADVIAEDMVENMDSNTNCRDMMISTFTNLSLVSALLFTVIVAVLYLEYDFDRVHDDPLDPLASTEIGKDFWKAIVFFNLFTSMIFTVGATFFAVLLIIYITPLSSEAAMKFMEMNGWASGLCFEFTIGGIMWMFFSIVCVNRVLFGVSAFILSCFGPLIVFFMLGYIWRQASKFEIKHHGFKRHSIVARVRQGKKSPKKQEKRKNKQVKPAERYQHVRKVQVRKVQTEE